MKNNKYLFTACISLLALSSCASYRSSTLNNPSYSVITYAPVKNNDLLILAKQFNKDDCQRYLDRDVLSKGYQPVQLYIQNDSNKDYYFSLDRLSLTCARPEDVADKVHTSTVGRAVGYGVGSLILWPLAIPAVVDGIKSSEANAALDIDFSAKAAKNSTIFRHSTFNKLIFVPIGDYQKNFQITLFDQESKKCSTFEVEVANDF